MKRFYAAWLWVAVLVCGLALPARAAEIKPDDQIVLDLSAENWVTTKSSRVVLNIEAAVTASTAGGMRATMLKAVSDVVKADWRLIGFSRAQDQTGMERWSAQYESRLPENALNGLADAAKKNSKAGMQITVAGIDFSPTLEERQAAISQTRAQIYKQASEQLAAANSALPGRAYRIAQIEFSGDSPVRTFAVMNAKSARSMLAASNANGMEMSAAEGSPAMEKSEKITLTAHIVFAAAPPAAAPGK